MFDKRPHSKIQNCINGKNYWKLFNYFWWKEYCVLVINPVPLSKLLSRSPCSYIFEEINWQSRNKSVWKGGHYVPLQNLKLIFQLIARSLIVYPLYMIHYLGHHMATWPLFSVAHSCIPRACSWEGQKPPDGRSRTPIFRNDLYILVVCCIKAIWSRRAVNPQILDNRNVSVSVIAGFLRTLVYILILPYHMIYENNAPPAW